MYLVTFDGYDLLGDDFELAYTIHKIKTNKALPVKYDNWQFKTNVDLGGYIE